LGSVERQPRAEAIRPAMKSILNRSPASRSSVTGLKRVDDATWLAHCLSTRSRGHKGWSSAELITGWSAPTSEFEPTGPTGAHSSQARRRPSRRRRPAWFGSQSAARVTQARCERTSDDAGRRGGPGCTASARGGSRTIQQGKRSTTASRARAIPATGRRRFSVPPAPTKGIPQ